ncbi:hypothetical protein KY334_03210 [Candidatus Woesearchaeota archaeon]|nr:hypothetical protein [Candidatus Woesearchaeota archaeon]
MDKKEIVKALKEAQEKSKKRNFNQTFELVMSFRNLNLKSPEGQLDFYSVFKHPFRKMKICGLVGEELLDSSKKVFDETIFVDNFEKFKDDKKAIKKLARKYDYFVGQANLMPQIATVFGRFFGPLGKMPNPKAGCVVPPSANLEAVKTKLNKQVHIKVKTAPVYQIAVGKEDGNLDNIAEDINNIYEQVVHKLPGEYQNVKSLYVKLTMGKAVRLI